MRIVTIKITNIYLIERAQFHVFYYADSCLKIELTYFAILVDQVMGKINILCLLGFEKQAYRLIAMVIFTMHYCHEMAS